MVPMFNSTTLHYISTLRSVEDIDGLTKSRGPELGSM